MRSPQDARDKLAREQCYQTCSKMSELSRDYQKLLIAQLPPAERTGHIPIHLGGGDRHAPNPRYPTTALYPNHPAIAKRLRLTVPTTDASVRWASEEDIEDDLTKLGLGRAAKERRARKDADRARREADRARRDADGREREHRREQRGGGGGHQQQSFHPQPGQPMPPGMLVGLPPPSGALHGGGPHEFDSKREFAWGDPHFPPGGFYGPPPPPGMQPYPPPPHGQPGLQQRPLDGQPQHHPPGMPPPPPGAYYPGYPPPPIMGLNGQMLIPHPTEHWEQQQRKGSDSRSPFNSLLPAPSPPPGMLLQGHPPPPPLSSPTGHNGLPSQPPPPSIGPDGKPQRGPHHHHYHHLLPPHHHHPLPSHHHHHLAPQNAGWASGPPPPQSQPPPPPPNAARGPAPAVGVIQAPSQPVPSF